MRPGSVEEQASARPGSVDEQDSTRPSTVGGQDSAQSGSVEEQASARLGSAEKQDSARSGSVEEQASARLGSAEKQDSARSGSAEKPDAVRPGSVDEQASGRTGPVEDQASALSPVEEAATSEASRGEADAGPGARATTGEAVAGARGVTGAAPQAGASGPGGANPKPRRSAFRALPPTTARAQRLRALATRLGATGAAVEAPCLESSDTGCARVALTPFFMSLDGLREGTTQTPTVIAAFGNSLIAGDRIVDIVRDELVAAFGGAGRGVLLVDRMAPYGGRTRTAAVSDGWEPRTLGELHAPPHPFGITGVYHVATERRARGRFKLDGEPRGTLWWKDIAGAGRLAVSVDGTVLTRTEPQGDGASRTTSFDLPPGAKWLDVTAEGEGAIVQGVVLQKDAPGVVLDMLGVPSSDATLYARLEEDALKAQLQQRDPKLLLFFLGGNESKRLEWKRTDLPTVRKDLTTLLRRTHAAAPGSACLVVGPMDAVQDSHEKGKPLSQRPFLEAAITAEREVALAEGCGFFNLYAAMGGAGSLARFDQAGFMHEDLVHPRGQGLDLLGQLVADALMAAWANEGATPASALTSSRAAPPARPAGHGNGRSAEVVP
ncbi:GDSL-type esterase/lipase family protein [Corallococcus sp. Z5C101001]|uniref:GDSL-type esterase/lipase family protein n=1 Tax=Corallococcus sp. Z5C101001 TaxID=2596829 RepID=UPI0021048FEB|nr:GDSL-type esterase/lipase family protein [Corallococcus sp. Z5C101001]